MTGPACALAVCALLLFGAAALADEPPLVAGAPEMRPLVAAWARGAALSVRTEGRGSSSGPAALLRGRATAAVLRRTLRPEELRALTAHYGEAPLALVVATDAIAVFVHPSNPIRGLRLAELAALFSERSTCGAPARIDTWDELALAPPWAQRRIGVYGPTAAGVRSAFRRAALCGAPYRAALREQPGGRTVVAAVAESPWAIGFAGRSELSPRVRALPIAASGGRWIPPDEPNTITGTYPLARPLWLVMPPPPLGESNRRLLSYALSGPGQALVRDHGFLPASQRAVGAAEAVLAR